MIVEIEQKIPTDRARRLVDLLEAREREVKAFSDAMNALKTAHNEAMKRWDGQIWSLRLEITTGQTSLIDAMEVGHVEPISNGSGQ